MWVTYFENIESDLAFYRTYSEFLDQVETEGKLTYVIDTISFEESIDSSPFKVYRSPNYGLVCYTSSDSENIKSLGMKLSETIGTCSANIPIKYFLKKENVDSSYFNLGLPLVSSELSMSLRTLNNHLREFGINVRKFFVDNQQSVNFEIESLSFPDLISDIEFVRFFCINFFISDFCYFGSVAKRDSNSLKFSLEISRKLKANEKKKLSKIENLSLSDTAIDLINIKSNSTVSQQIMSVVSKISP